MSSRNIFLLVVFFISTNLVLLFYKFFEIIPQVYFLGFRLNPFLLIFLLLMYLEKRPWTELIEPFKTFGKFKHWFIGLFIPVLAGGIILLTGLLFGKFRTTHPEYFYEFGISSILDFPTYLVWTLPILLGLIYIWMILFRSETATRVLIHSLTFALGFIGIFIINFNPKLLLNYVGVLLLIFSVMCWTYGFYGYTKSLWVSSFTFFVQIYVIVLLFGSTDSFLIKTFFARNYEKWDGFFSIILIKNLPSEAFISIPLITFGILFFILTNRRRSLQ